MGGYGTLYHALKYPEKFTYGYAMSPATADWFTTLIDARADKKVFPPFTIEVGTEDTTVNNAESEALARYMKDKGLTCEWIARSGVLFESNRVHDDNDSFQNFSMYALMTNWRMDKMNWPSDTPIMNTGWGFRVPTKSLYDDSPGDALRPGHRRFR